MEHTHILLLISWKSQTVDALIIGDKDFVISEKKRITELNKKQNVHSEYKLVYRKINILKK